MGPDIEASENVTDAREAKSSIKKFGPKAVPLYFNNEVLRIMRQQLGSEAEFETWVETEILRKLESNGLVFTSIEEVRAELKLDILLASKASTYLVATPELQKDNVISLQRKRSRQAAKPVDVRLADFPFLNGETAGPISDTAELLPAAPFDDPDFEIPPDERHRRVLSLDD